MQTLAELPFVGGSPALDFVNTAEERGHPDASDVIVASADLELWGRRYGLLDDTATTEHPEGELERAIDARETLYRLFLARIRDAPAEPSDLARLAELAAHAFAAGSLTPAAEDRLQWTWDARELATVRHVAVTSAVDLLASDAGARLKQCPGDHCGWFFLDTTKRGNRRWCRMSECGQDAKSQRRRARAARAPVADTVAG